MKRCWFGLILLLLLLAVSIGATWYMSRVHAPMAETAMQAAQRAMKGDWGNALSLAEKLRAQWDSRWGIVASFADHEPMEQINSLFAQLETYAAAADPVGFSAVCAALSAALDAMGDASSFTWWNLL